MNHILPPSFLATSVGEPLARWTALLALHMKMALDQAASAIRFVACSAPSNDDWRRISRESKEARDAWRARGWLDDPAVYHRAPPPLTDPNIEPAAANGSELLHLSFASEYQPRPGEPGGARWADKVANHTAHAFVLQHRDAPRRWLMCIHGYGMGIPSLDQHAFHVAWLHRELGWNVLLPILPLHGPRRVYRQSGEGFFAGDVLDTLHAESQAIWDLRRLSSWLRAQGDPHPCVYGISLGAYTAALLSCLEGGFDRLIAGVPAVDFVELGLLHTPETSLRRAEACGVEWDVVRDLYRVISPLSLPSRLPRKSLGIFAGLADCVVPVEQARRLWEHWGQPPIAWYEGSHFSFPFESRVTAFIRDALCDSARRHIETKAIAEP